MRTFPGIWVPPGGHIDVGETLIEAGLRELRVRLKAAFIFVSSYHVSGRDRA